MKKALLCLLLMLVLCGCAKAPEEKESPAEEEIPEKQEEVMEEKTMKMRINTTEVEVEWEENESVEALKALCADGEYTIAMSMYGGFEQVGEIGAELPRHDTSTVTESGDIVLYSGDSLVVFYGSNSWSYTRLGKIVDKTELELIELLSRGDVTITLYQE